MRVNRNKGKCLFGADERTPDVYATVTASYCLGLSALKTRDNPDEICKPPLECYQDRIKPNVKAQIQKGNARGNEK